VTAIDDKAFVLKDGIWTDTAFDPGLMTTTPLPFPSDLFLEFLIDHPESGKYFALGLRVIVVIDGLAYETVEGETDFIPDPLEPDEVTPSNFPQPSPQAQADSGPVTSPPPATGAETYTTLTASIAEGIAPLEVNFSGELVGGPDNNQDFYCVESTFTFGDGISQSSSPGCIEWHTGIEIQRRYAANYLYEEPGEYQVIFKLGQAESEPLTIIVNSPGTSSSTTSEPQASTTQPASNASKPTNTTDTSSPQSIPLNCISSLTLLPLLALVFSLWRGQNS
jgi:hypothetical protein